MITLSVIIPFYDSYDTLIKFLPEIVKRAKTPRCEFILVDSSGNQGVDEFCKSLGVIHLSASMQQRAAQMNQGAFNAIGDKLLFMHIDSVPPQYFDKMVLEAFESGAKAGCFRLQFDLDHWFLQLSARFTKYKVSLARGGDQGLFIDKTLFEEMGGFKEIPIMEDIEFCHRLIKRKTFEILPSTMVTSARKYKQNGVFRLQFIFTFITILYWLGVKPKDLRDIYNGLVKG